LLEYGTVGGDRCRTDFLAVTQFKQAARPKMIKEGPQPFCSLLLNKEKGERDEVVPKFNLINHCLHVIITPGTK